MFSDFLLEKYKKLFDDVVIKGLSLPVKRSIRVNTLKIGREQLVRRLENKGFRLEKISWVKNGYFVKKAPFSIGATPEYLLGYYFIQDGASMYACEVLGPKKGQRVLDMAAAPGGKTTYLAQLMGGAGTVISTEISRERMKSLNANIQRLGLENVITVRMNALDAKDLGMKFDCVLLDAPCTGTGTVSKNPEAARKEEEDVLKCTAIQRPMLKAGLGVLAKKGTLVYSTCSVLPEENELIVREALEMGFKLKPIRYGKPAFTSVYGNAVPEEMKNAKRFYPHAHDTQGFFICKIQK